MIEAVIFDMDGVLIDSEPLWQEAEKKVFASVGIQLTTEECMETTGLRVDEVVKYRYQRQPWAEKSFADVEEEILCELELLIDEKGETMPGVDSILALFFEHQLRLALASSSHLRIIKRVLSKLGMTETFEVIHSGEFEELGKPHPAIYLTTLEELNLNPHQAFAIEDSLNGLISAKAARLKTVVVPDPSNSSDTRFDLADLKLNFLHEFTEKHLSDFNQT